MSEIERVAVIGSGSIGASFTALFAAHGFRTSVYDIVATQEAFLSNMVREAAVTISKLRGQDATTTDELQSQMKSLISFSTDLETALVDADFVQENGPERLEPKLDLLVRIDKLVKPTTIIASSTSGFMCSTMQKALTQHPERFVVGHPFNPPHLIPLVEVIGGSHTSPSTIRRAMTFYTSVGKQPIHVKKEVPGHIANRLQGSLLREIIHLISSDVASVADIETAMEYGPGLRWGVMGPSTLFHLGGGPKGAEHFKNHLLGPMLSWAAEENPVLTEEVGEKWVKQTEEAVGGKSYAALTAERDRMVLELLRIKQDDGGKAKTVQNME